MAKKAKPTAAKPGAEKSAKVKPVATKPTKGAAKPVKAAVKAAVKKPAAPRAPKAPAAPLSLGTAPATVPPALSDRYASLEDAKNATIDTLLASIEAAEARLLEVKRCSSFDQLEPLANGSMESNPAS